MLRRVYLYTCCFRFFSHCSYGRKECSSAGTHVEIVFDIRDVQLYAKIREVLGGGYITIRPNGQSGRLIIKNRDILINLVKLINGHMRTPKIEAFHRLINWINLNNNELIPLHGIDKTPLHESSWLLGF